MATSCMGIVCPPFAALGEKVCQRSLKRTSAGGIIRSVLSDDVSNTTHRADVRRTCIAGILLKIIESA